MAYLIIILILMLGQNLQAMGDNGAAGPAHNPIDNQQNNQNLDEQFGLLHHYEDQLNQQNPNNLNNQDDTESSSSDEGALSWSEFKTLVKKNPKISIGIVTGFTLILGLIIYNEIRERRESQKRKRELDLVTRRVDLVIEESRKSREQAEKILAK